MMQHPRVRMSPWGRLLPALVLSLVHTRVLCQSTLTDMGSLLALCSQPSPLAANVLNCDTQNSIPINDVHQFYVQVGPRVFDHCFSMRGAEIAHPRKASKPNQHCCAA